MAKQPWQTAGNLDIPESSCTAFPVSPGTKNCDTQLANGSAAINWALGFRSRGKAGCLSRFPLMFNWRNAETPFSRPHLQCLISNPQRRNVKFCFQIQDQQSWAAMQFSLHCYHPNLLCLAPTPGLSPGHCPLPYLQYLATLSSIHILIYLQCS